jgi:pilus assembly protein Flp/PilA
MGAVDPQTVAGVRAEPFERGHGIMEKLLQLVVAMHTRVEDFAKKDRGATATEYAILVAFIALLIIVGVTFFGDNLNNWFNRLGNHVNSFNS